MINKSVGNKRFVSNDVEEMPPAKDNSVKLNAPRTLLLNATLMALLIVSARMSSDARDPKEQIRAEAEHKSPKDEAEIDKYIAQHRSERKLKTRISSSTLVPTVITKQLVTSSPKTFSDIENSATVSELEKFVSQYKPRKKDRERVKFESVKASNLLFSDKSETAISTTISWKQRSYKYEPLIIEAAKRHDVDPRILWTIAFLQSQFRTDLVSPDGARGIMQFMPETAKKYNLEDPHDPYNSFDAAARYVKDIQARFGDRVDLVLASYIAGQEAVEAYSEGHSVKLANGKIINRMGRKTSGIPPYRTTQKFVARALRVMDDITHKGFFPDDMLVQYQPAKSSYTLPSVPSVNISVKMKSQPKPNVKPVSLHKESKQEEGNSSDLSLSITRPRRVTPEPIVNEETTESVSDEASTPPIELPESRSFRESRFRRVSLSNYYNLEQPE
jgi:hypothetical protein